MRQPASLIRLDGSDSRRVLHGQTSAAIETARPGQWIPTCCISPTARLRALAEVLVDGDGAWLAVWGGDGEQVHQALDRVLFPADRVHLQQPQPGWLLTPVPGRQEPPNAAEPGVWQELAGGGGWQLGSGALGLLLLLRQGAELPPAWAEREPLEAAEQERWRIQNGLPAAPGEINDDHNPFELGLAGRVSLSKGCYVGQVLRDPSAAADGSRLGLISSALELATGDWIGLALVRRRGLDRSRLQAGVGEAGACLEISRPDGFVPPPVGAGPQDS
jgi:folate-binding Fe-S cluster repair protein YgfZ